MAVGPRVRSQGTGQIQIGAGYRNLQLTKSGTLNTGSFSGGGIGGSPPFASWSPSGALASTNGTTNLHVCRYINDSVATTTGFTLVQSGVTCFVYASNQAPNKTLEYYTFNTTERAASGQVGLRMRGEDGRCSMTRAGRGCECCGWCRCQWSRGLPLKSASSSRGARSA